MKNKGVIMNNAYDNNYVCLECEKHFHSPRHYIEKHGLDTPPYEEWYGCPYCSGAYQKIPDKKEEGI